ncbi:MAG: hypothetical protein KBD60_06235 [Sterolibacterium sp.]|jgi:hypothetical protein|nr:hypothetical protein [Sterolibacterium sp.]
MRADGLTADLFDALPGAAGGLDGLLPGRMGCAVEIAAVMAQAIDAARERGLDRAQIVARMSFVLGERLSEATLNGYTSQAHAEREISLRRAMAFDAALGADVLLGLYAQKCGGRRVVSADEAAFIELGRIQQQEQQLAARKRALQTLLKAGVGV